MMDTLVQKEKKNTNELVLNLFGKAIPKGGDISYADINRLALQVGYMVHPDLCNKEVFSFLRSKKVDYNSTFYKSWSDVTSRDRDELWVEQVRHYASTYGTAFKETPYVINEGSEVPDFTKYKVILPITPEEVNERCKALLYSGVALKQETLNAVIYLLTELNGIETVDITKVKNKESKMYLYKLLVRLPEDPSEMVRYLLYLAIGKTMLINDYQTLTAIAGSKLSIQEYVEAFGSTKLASVFHRYKLVFLNFKKANRDNSKIVNALRKLADTYHKAYEFGFFEKLLSDVECDLGVLADMLNKTTNFTKVKLLQAILVKQKDLNIRAFGIRNQKLFIKEKDNVGTISSTIFSKKLKEANIKFDKIEQKKPDYDGMYNIIYASLIGSIQGKACKIKVPKGINLTIPLSEKSFIGNFPIGTSFDMSDTDSIIGINWRSEDGADDLDLSALDLKGNKIGWNSGYYNGEQSIVYSGDMTYANPESTELLYMAKGYNNTSIIQVNLFRGAPNSKFKFFIAQEKIEKMRENYMVDPNNIISVIDCEMDSDQKSLGILCNNKFVIAQLRTGRGAVAGVSITDKYAEYMKETLDCYLSLSNVLVDAGFTVVEEGEDINLSNLSKDTLINLFS